MAPLRNWRCGVPDAGLFKLTRKHNSRRCVSINPWQVFGQSLINRLGSAFLDIFPDMVEFFQQKVRQLGIFLRFSC